MKIIFTGDLMLGGKFYNKKISKSNFSDDIFHILKGADHLIIDFENVIGISNDLREDKDHLLFCSEKTFDSFISLYPHSIFCIGNNHITDFGDQSFHNTINVLKKNQIKFYGAGTEKEAQKPLQLNEKVVIFHFSTDEYFVNSEIASNDRIGCCYYNFQKIKESIENYNINNKRLIITFHWGHEHIHYPSPEQIKLAHNLIDIGADLIIGHHPHTIQAFEVYKGKYIFYSLGNFFFPDFFQYRTGAPYEWKDKDNKSIIVKVEIDESNKMEISYIGTQFLQNSFKINSSKLSEKLAIEVSNKMLGYKNKNDYAKFFCHNLNLNNKKKSIINYFLYSFFTFLNIFKKNKFPYIIRLRSLLRLRTIKYFIKLSSNPKNWFQANQKEIINMNNKIFNFQRKS